MITKRPQGWSHNCRQVDNADRRFRHAYGKLHTQMSHVCTCWQAQPQTGRQILEKKLIFRRHFPPDCFPVLKKKKCCQLIWKDIRQRVCNTRLDLLEDGRRPQPARCPATISDKKITVESVLRVETPAISPNLSDKNIRRDRKKGDEYQLLLTITQKEKKNSVKKQWIFVTRWCRSARRAC